MQFVTVSILRLNWLQGKRGNETTEGDNRHIQMVSTRARAGRWVGNTGANILTEGRPGLAKPGNSTLSRNSPDLATLKTGRKPPFRSSHVRYVTSSWQASRLPPTAAVCQNDSKRLGKLCKAEHVYSAGNFYIQSRGVKRGTDKHAFKPSKFFPCTRITPHITLGRCTVTQA